MSATRKKARERVDWQFKGHFIAAESCHWFRTTDVGDFRISSIGDYRPTPLPGFPAYNEIGFGRTHETMVFKLGREKHTECGIEGCPMLGARLVGDWSNVDFDAYNSNDEAAAGHEKMVRKYLRRVLSPRLAGLRLESFCSL